jgi:hypothetical protein
MFSVRMEQLHSKRPTLNVERPMLNSEGGSAAHGFSMREVARFADSVAGVITGETIGER